MQELKERIELRVTETEKQMLRDMAYMAGMTMSEYIRNQVLGQKSIVRYVKNKKGKKEAKEI